jgi:hypothetical protein
MKKSFLYAAQVALITALLFTGCPQDADDDDDDSGGKPVNTPGSDLSYIAYAFGYGVDTVQVVSDIYLGNYELVIPAGKTLDFDTIGKSIRGITDESKIIAQGTLILDDNQAKLDFTATPGAKIIADTDFINKHVAVNYYTDDPAAPTGKWTDADWENAGIKERPSANKDDTSVKIFATWKQIVLIDTFENFENYGEEGSKPLVFIDGISGLPKYLAINAPQREINGDDVEVINKRAGGLRFYLVGEPVKFNFNGLDHVLDLTKYPDLPEYYKIWAPVPTESTPTPPPDPNGGNSVFYTAGSNRNYPSLTIAGSMKISDGKIKAPGGLTVWGIVDNTGVKPGSTVIMDGTTPFTAWTAFLYGAEFGGPVNLLGSIASDFSGPVTFNDKLQIAGPVTFQQGIFKGEVLFGNSVQFPPNDPSKAPLPIDFQDKVTFVGDVRLNEGAEFTPGKDNTYYRSITGIDFDKIDTNLTHKGGDASYKISGNTVTRPASGSYSVDVVVSGENVTVTGSDPVHFVKNATFEGDVTFEVLPKFGTVSAAVAADAAGSRTTTVINGLAVFKKGADFGGTLDTAPDGLKVIGNSVIIEEAVFETGEYRNITDLKLGNSTNPAVVFTAGTAAHTTVGSGSINIPQNGGIEFTDGILTFTGEGGTLGAAVDLNNVTVKLGKDAKMNFNQSSNPITVAQTDGEGGFKIIGKAKLDGGQIRGEGSGVVLAANGGLILAIPGAPFNAGLPNKNASVGVYNATIDLSKGGAIVFAGTASRIVLRDNANIKLGADDDDNPILAVPVGKSTTSGATIIAGSSATGTETPGGVALLTGSESITPVITGVGTVAGAYYKPGTEGVDVFAKEWSNVLSGNNGFVWIAGTSSAAGSIAVSTAPSNVTEADKIAVFEIEDDKSLFN